MDQGVDVAIEGTLASGWLMHQFTTVFNRLLLPNFQASSHVLKSPLTSQHDVHILSVGYDLRLYGV